MIKDSRGFTSTILLSVLPFFLTLSIVLFSLFLLLKQYSQNQHHCQTTLLKTQNQLIPHFEALLNLNPLAKAIRLKIKLAQIQLATALATANPVLVTQATAQLRVLEIAKKSLMAKQNLVILTGKTKAQLSLYQYKSLFYKNQNQSKHILKSVLNIENPQLQLSPLPFAIEKTDFVNPPIYRLKQSFKDQQTLKGKWNVLFMTTNNHWLHNWIPINFELKGSCATTIERRENKWQSVLTKVKSLQNFVTL